MAKRTTHSSANTGEAFGLPSPSELQRLKISNEVAWYMVTRGFEFPEHPPMIKTPEPGELVPEAMFSAEAVDKVIAAFKVLRHTKGKWAGQALIPDGWQVAYILAPIFGWLQENEDGRWVRVISTGFVDVPRKNGKSTTCGGIGIYLTGADGEPGAEVVAAASTRDQAGFVFAPIKALVDKAPGLKGKFISRTGKILHPKSGSYFQVISSAADAQHGANLHGAIIDELHIHKTPDLVKTLETGTGSRDQPLVMMITTADDGKPDTIYAQKRKYVERLEKRVFDDPSTYGVVFALPRTADPLDPENWPIANPGFPISPTRAYLVKAAKLAKNSPAEMAEFKRLHCGMRTKQTTAYIDLQEWDDNAGARIFEASMMGREAYGGLDLGSVSDLTALVWLFPHPDRPGFDMIFRFWTPEDNLPALDERTSKAASLWVEQGWLTTTPGNVTDYDFIKAQILDDMDMFDVASIGLDRWNATHLANQLLDHGVPLVEVGQGYQSMSPALKEIKRLTKVGSVGDERLHHGGNPVMKWMVDNLAVAIDPAGNVKPDKKNAADKIDGVSATCNAMFEVLQAGLWPDTDDNGFSILD